MIAAWLIGGALCMATGDGAARAAAPDREAYRAAAAAAGRDADAHVDLALWCEARGMAAEKTRHLARAVLLDPENARARGLLGQVKHDGRWLRAADVAKGVDESAEKEALTREYFERRAQTRDDADDQYKLALWCEENGLKEPMTAHLHRTLQLDPGREGAWRRLGFKKVGKRWVDPKVEAALKAERDAQAKADRVWEPRLEKLRDMLYGKVAARKDQAREELAAIADPRAVPAIWRTFAKGGNESRQRVAVDVLSRIDGPGASLALATLAVYSPHAAIRSDAAALLPQRDPREFAGFLAASIRDEVKYKVKPVEGPGGRGELLVEGEDANVRRIYRPMRGPTLMPGDQVGTDANGNVVANRPIGAFVGPILDPLGAAALIQGGPTLMMLGAMTPDAEVTGLPISRGGYIRGVFHQPRPAVAAAALERGGIPSSLAQTVVGRIEQSQAMPFAFGRMMVDSAAVTGGTLRPIFQQSLQIPVGQMTREARASALVAREQLAADVAGIEARNAPIRQTNERALAVLKAVSGEDLGKDRTKWMDWVTDLQGYGQPLRAASAPPATVVEEVPIAYQPRPAAVVPVSSLAGFRIGPSCFAGGTLVRTLQGDRSIETIQPGDLVLSQDPTSGRFDFKPVVEALHNPPNWTYAVDLGAETLHPTGIHRFWKAGQGWVMARDLKPGDRLRTAGGSVEVVSVEKGTEKVPVFNLLLGDGDSYHVGASGLLVHDNGLVAPVASPFDAVPELAAADKP